MKHILTYILFLGVCLTSCQLGKHYTRPDLHLPERLDSMATDTMSIADFRWWEIYTDTTLQTLIRQTLEHNKDMLTAAARLKEMAAQKRIAYANLFDAHRKLLAVTYDGGCFGSKLHHGLYRIGGTSL